MFTTITYLASGNSRQTRAYDVMEKLQLFRDLAAYQPILCGTIPIEIDTETSDLDVILEVSDFDQFEEKVRGLYGEMDSFHVKRKSIRTEPVIKVNFSYSEFEFELFAQNQPVMQQYAYLHMIIEHAVLKQQPELKQAIIQRKKQGMKTEPAFCACLGLEGDPYEALLRYGRRKQII